MSKINITKIRFHWVHFGAILFLGIYFILSKIHLAWSIHDPNITSAFFKIYLFGAFFAVFFLYIFSHDKFFPLAREIEKKEKKKENRYLRKYLHHGKIFATLTIGIIGGPVFSSLTARLLLNHMKFGKYLIVLLANIPSTLFTVGLANGFIKFLSF